MFADAMDPHLTSMPRERFSLLDPDVTAELAIAFTAFKPLAEGRPTASQAERYRTRRAVRSLLEDLAEPSRPLTIVLDDVHWADPASTDLLLHLLAYPPRSAVLLVVAFRPGQTPSRLAPPSPVPSAPVSRSGSTSRGSRRRRRTR